MTRRWSGGCCWWYNEGAEYFAVTLAECLEQFWIRVRFTEQVPESCHCFIRNATITLMKWMIFQQYQRDSEEDYVTIVTEPNRLDIISTFSSSGSIVLSLSNITHLYTSNKFHRLKDVDTDSPIMRNPYCALIVISQVVATSTITGSMLWATASCSRRLSFTKGVCVRSDCNLLRTRLFTQAAFAEVCRWYENIKLSSPHGTHTDKGNWICRITSLQSEDWEHGDVSGIEPGDVIFRPVINFSR